MDWGEHQRDESKGERMTQKPTAIVGKMEADNKRFYPAKDVGELAIVVATRHPGTSKDYIELLKSSVKEGKLVKVRNGRGEAGFASASAVEGGLYARVRTDYKAPGRRLRERDEVVVG